MNSGRPTLLDDHLYRKIRDLVLDGLNLRQISESLDIPYHTMRDWDYENYKGFSDKLLSYKHERLLQKAESNLEVLLDAEDDRLKGDMTKFTLESLNKRFYSKRQEQTGADGKELPTPILMNYVPSNNITEQNKSDDQEDTNSTGGDIG